MHVGIESKLKELKGNIIKGSRKFFWWEVSAQVTYKVLPCRGILGLFPACWPSHEDCIVLHSSQSCRLDHYGEPVPQAGRHDDMGETFHLLCCHGCFEVLQVEKQSKVVKSLENMVTGCQ